MEDYSFDDEKPMTGAAEPSAKYGMKVRRMSREELERDYITLEESDRRISELIYKHFHPEA